MCVTEAITGLWGGKQRAARSPLSPKEGRGGGVAVGCAGLHNNTVVISLSQRSVKSTTTQSNVNMTVNHPEYVNLTLIVFTFMQTRCDFKGILNFERLLFCQAATRRLCFT